MKKLVVFFILWSCSLHGWAQSSGVQISNLDVSLRIITDDGGNIIRTKCAAVDSLFMDIAFSVNALASCSKAYIYIGTVKGSFDVRKMDVLFTHPDSSYYVNYYGVTKKVDNNLALVIPKLSKAELRQYHYITLFVEDNTGLTSNTLYFNKK